jgi:hypothetical protein
MWDGNFLARAVRGLPFEPPRRKMFPETAHARGCRLMIIRPNWHTVMSRAQHRATI